MSPFTRMQPLRSSGGDGHISRGLKSKHMTAEEEIATMFHSVGLLPPLSGHKTRAKSHGLAPFRGGKRNANSTRTTTEPLPPPPAMDHDITPKTSHRKSRSCPDAASACHILGTTAATNPLPRPAVPRDNADVFQDLVGDAPDLECHVCSDSLCKGKSVALVRCFHIFHQCCLEMSLQQNRTCPLCHVPVDNDDDNNNAESWSCRSVASLVSMEEGASWDDDREEDVASRTSGSTARRSVGSIILDENSGTFDEDDTTLAPHRVRTQAWAAPPPLLIPTPSAERGSITEILNMSPAAESFYDVATVASSVLFSATRCPSDERRRRLDNIAAGGLSVNSISSVDEIVYNDFEKAIQEGNLDKAYVHGWRYCYFCLAYSITGRNLSKVVRLLEFVVKQMDEHDRQRHLIESPANRAAKFVSSLQELYDRLLGSRVESVKDQKPKQRQPPLPICHLIQPLNEDDVRYMAEEMLKYQGKLRAACSTSANLVVDIGYLYMPESSLDCVMTDGLLNLFDGHAPRIPQSCRSGTSYGNGVYTSDNPYAYHDPRGGQVGVLVARLKGVQKECFMDEGTNGILEAEYDSVHVIGDDPRVHITVLRQTSQCLPLAYFPNAVIEPGNSRAGGNYAVSEIHAELQKLIDEFFNNAQTTYVRVVEPFVSLPFVPGHRASEARHIRESATTKNETIIYNAPSSLSEEEESCLFQNVESGNKPLGDCCICRSTLSGPGTAVVLKGCNHHFHRDCIHRAVQHSRKCPLCRVEIGEPRRTMPSGKLFVRFDETGTCDSFSQGCIVLRYRLTRGIQQSHHGTGSPGLPFQGAERTAFLPDNDIGKSLLTRLKYAFQHGLTFYIAAASSTSSDSSVIWAIPHKTKLDGQGTAGFPDPTYFSKVNQELDLLGVPSAEALEASKPRSRTRRHKDSEVRRQHQNLPRAPPPPADLRQTVDYEAPEMLPPAGVFTTVRQPVLKSKLFRLKTGGRSTNSDPVCGVCLASLSSERAAVELNECGHQFHTACIQSALGQNGKCPCCEIVVNSQQGTMPSGNMIIIFDPDRAYGGKIGCIVVRYLIPSGRQKVYHPFPGNAHCSVDKIVYLSGDDAGLSLLLRLRYAFSKGLTFKVSSSQSANGRNQLSWAIPHPDENGDYLPKCNRALDRFGVPSGEELRRATI